LCLENITLLKVLVSKHMVGRRDVVCAESIGFHDIQLVCGGNWGGSSFLKGGGGGGGGLGQRISPQRFLKFVLKCRRKYILPHA
jgi:hypothetical protein